MVCLQEDYADKQGLNAGYIAEVAEETSEWNYPFDGCLFRLLHNGNVNYDAAEDDLNMDLGNKHYCYEGTPLLKS